MKLSLMWVLATCAVLDLAAMPTKEESEKVEPIVQKLLAPEWAALKAGKKTRAEVAAAVMKLADAADTDAAKLLMMKGAFVLYVRDGNLEKAVETMNTLEKTIADLPPQNVTNMIEMALLGVARKDDGARLYRLLDATKNNVGVSSPSPRDGEVAQPINKDRTTVKSIIDGMIKVPGRAYWLSATEVTQGQWESVMGYNFSSHKGPNLPVENVSRDECAVFLEKLNGTEEVLLTRFEFGLPTLAEWRYAAQAGGSGTDCWIRPGVVGNVLDMAWVAENSSNQTHVVASKAANAFGFYDMLGNVWEWMKCDQEEVGCRHGGAFGDAAAECTVVKGYHSRIDRRFDSCGLRVVARIRSAVADYSGEK